MSFRGVEREFVLLQGMLVLLATIFFRRTPFSGRFAVQNGILFPLRFQGVELS